MRLIVRILAAPLVSVALLVASGVASQGSLHAVATAFSQLREQALPQVRTLGEWQTRLATLNAHLYRTINLVESLDPRAIEDARRRIQDEATAIQAGIAQMAERADPAVRESLDTAGRQLAIYRDKATNAISVAADSPPAATLLLASAERAFTAGFGAVQTVAKAVEADAQKQSEAVAARSDRAIQVSVALTATAAVLSLALAVWIARRLTRRLDEAVGVSEAIARGELDVCVPHGGNDEVGRLMQSLSVTVGQLDSVLGTVRQASLAVDAAAREISAGGSDLSERTEIAAGGLQATSHAMAELTAVIERSGATMDNMTQLAQEATRQASHGAAVVANVVSTMESIRDGARRIGEITGAIDAIAFQTNILALNAAVEAARAGEQGRGFAVVASEVRALANRSAEAAREVKTLIGQSTAMTQEGARSADAAGAAIQGLVGTVRSVGDMVQNFGSATVEQAAALARISGEVSQIDSMMQENSALAEQSSAASESLHQQSLRMQETLARFRLSAVSDARAQAAAAAEAQLSTVA